MLKRFLLYGCGGWVMEIGFTGLSSVIFEHDRSATAKTYLWMHPIYGIAGLALEALSKRLGSVPRLLRAALYLPIIYATELSTGWLLRRVLGRCPWDYGERGLGYKGLIRFDYAPVWYAAALLFEPAARQIARASRAPHPRWSSRSLWR